MVEQWQNLPLLGHCPAFSAVLDALALQCDIYSARLMRLQAGAEILGGVLNYRSRHDSGHFPRWRCCDSLQ